MSLRIEIIPKTLHFKQPAGTSRGIYTERRLWYIRLTSADNPLLFGLGECAPLFDLSAEYNDDYERVLHHEAENGTRKGLMMKFFCETIHLSCSVLRQPFFLQKHHYAAIISGFMIHLLREVRRVFASTDWSGWAIMTKCCSACMRNCLPVSNVSR